MNLLPWVAVLALAVGLGYLARFGLTAPSWPVMAGLALLAGAALLHKPLADVANGVWLRREKVLRPGHYIRVEGRDDVEGYVVWIGWRRTRLETPTGDFAVLPNRVLANSIFTDFHLPSNKHEIVIELDVDADVDRARVGALLEEECLQLGREVPGAQTAAPSIRELPGRFPGCRRYLVACRTQDGASREAIRHLLTERFEDRLRRERIAVPSLSVSRNKDKP